MDELCSYLNFHREIEKVVFLAGIEIPYSRIESIILDGNLKSIVLTGFFSDMQIENFKSNIEFSKAQTRINKDFEFEYVPYSKFEAYTGNWALVVDGFAPEAIMDFAILRPKYLLVNMFEGNVSAFRIWEKFKGSCEYIQIRTLKENRHSRMLSWNRRPDTDIELSVVFPTYNVADYLEQCIESVTKWKAPYIEFLFVNDGSKDSSRDIILKWSQKDPRVKLIDKENGGCASARQLGMEKAKGQYIGFIDPDDFIDERMYFKLLEAAMVGSYEIAYCGYNEYYGSNNTHKKVMDELGLPYCHGTVDAERIKNLVAFCRVAIWRGIYKKTLIEREKIHFYTDLRRFDDLPFKVETFAFAKSVVAVPEYLYYYRLSRPGQDVSADDERLYVHFDIFKHLNDSIVSRGDQELIDHLQMVKIQTHLYALSKIKPQFKEYYTKHAKEDLLTTGEYYRTYDLAEQRIGKDRAEAYKRIMNDNFEQKYILN